MDGQLSAGADEQREPAEPALQARRHSPPTARQKGMHFRKSYDMISSGETINSNTNKEEGTYHSTDTAKWRRNREQAEPAVGEERGWLCVAWVRDKKRVQTF